MAGEPTGFELVVAARSGDTTSFGLLLKRHAPRLLSLARQMVGADAAEDVVQEAMIDAYRGWWVFGVMLRLRRGCIESRSTGALRSDVVTGRRSPRWSRLTC